MQRDGDSDPSAADDDRWNHRRFLEYLAGFMGLGLLAFLGMLYGLSVTGSLPAAPITTTYCIDEKFKYLAEHDLDNVDMLAVGSSVTWRNLDMRPLVARGLAEHPMNAAPCYLHMDQVAFYARFMLDHLHRVETVITVIAPRDFAHCPASDRAFFSPDKVESYLFEDASPLPIYVTNFRPIPFFRDASQVAERRSNPGLNDSLVMGPYGAGPIEGSAGWGTPPRFDARCFAALARFEQMLAAQGVELVLVSFPSSPEWRKAHDPDGTVVADFEARLRAALTRPSTIFMPSTTIVLDPSLYFDAIHFRWQGAQEFSAIVAERLAVIRASAGQEAAR